jgi:serine phosphatase RsbU (regulator of sigma subunit)/ligand-binding sensor domain-containing protein
MTLFYRNQYKNIFQTAIIVFLIVSSSFGQDSSIKFENITMLDGLSTSNTRCIFQDSYGYVWFGTMNGGLDRYDGYTFKNYAHDENDSLSIISNAIYGIAEDAESNLWIATVNGISHYNRKEDNFTNYYLFENFKELTDNRVWTVFADSKNRIWFGTNQLSAILYDKESDRFIPMGQKTDIINDYSHKNISNFTEDHNGVIWGASATDGLLWFDEENNKFMNVSLRIQNNDLPEIKSVFRVFSDSDNNLWVMTPTDLIKYFPSSAKIVHLLNYEVPSPINSGYEGEIWEDSNKNVWVVHINLPHPIKFLNLSNEYIEVESEELNSTDFYIDSFGTIWVSDWMNGLFKFVPARQDFYHLQSEIKEQLSVDAQYIRPLCQSVVDSNIIYFGMDVPGFISYNKLTKTYSHIRKNQTKYISENKMFANEDGTIWIGYWNEGLALWNPKTDKITPYFSSSNSLPDLSNTSITHLSKAPDGSLWIGTFNGLFHLSKDKSRLESILVTNVVTSIYQIDKILWLGTHNDGLLKYDIESKKILTSIKDDLANPFNNNVIWDIYMDKDSYLWLATNGGLIQFDPITEKYRVFDKTDGLADESIVAILPDDNGDLWMSTRSGISRLQLDSNEDYKFKNYDTNDNLLFSDFRYPFKLKDENGTLYFGGERGTYYFKPKKEEHIASKIYFTDLAINGKKVSNNYLHKIKNENSNIELRYDQNTISLGFTGIHTGESNKYRYAHYHYLEGYEYDWIYSFESQVQYLNLDPGKYTFCFRAANRDGNWNKQEALLNIVILPPWWKTWWAYSLYILFVFGFLYSVRRFELNRQNKNAEIKESKLRAQAAEAQAKVIQAENERKTQELEEARNLQLSMLPKSLPELLNLNIAVYMNTATEVGGDYYDFHQNPDGTLTVVIGDATGHGMKAGSMVTVSKSLFNTLAMSKDIQKTFKRMSRVIKEMKFLNLSMCLTMLKMKDNKLQLSSAGMPPVFLFKADENIVEEIAINGMPLGTFSDFPYELKESMLKKGDTLLLMSDGFPELMNEQKEMYGYDRVKMIFSKIAKDSPKQIIENLKNEESKWIGESDPDDDVTFVVIKVK